MTKLLQYCWIILLFYIPTIANAAQTIVVDSNHIDTIYRWHIHKDTLYLDSLPQTISSDQFLLDMLAQQSKELYQQDSLLRDSLLASLRYRDSILRIELSYIQDSIRLLSQTRPINTVKEDSTTQLKVAIDSVTQEINRLRNSNPEIDIQSSIVPDMNEDLAEIAYQLKSRNNPWKKEANTLIQFSQNYISPNWYKGGSSNFAILAQAKGFINYKKDNFLWENTGEWRIGIATVNGDTLRKHNITDDLFRLYSKVGYQVVKKLYISASMEFQTNFWNSWNTNSTTVKTAFLTPIRYNINVGVDYQPIKNMSIMFAPATYKMVYSLYHEGNSEQVNVTNYGIEKGKQILNEIGSSIRVKWGWKPFREIALDTEFYFYTNYRRVEIDWQINFDFFITRFLSARLMLHPRFDNTVIYTGDERAKLQFKELLSVGFSHKFR